MAVAAGEALGFGERTSAAAVAAGLVRGIVGRGRRKTREQRSGDFFSAC